MNTQLIEHIHMDEKTGVPRLAGHRLTVHFIIYLLDQEGMTPHQVAEQYDLTLGQIYGVLSFYHDNKAVIDDLLKRERLVLDTVENLDEGTDDQLWQVMTVKEIAELFQVDESTIREAAAKSWVYGRKAGGTWLISRQDAEQRWGSNLEER